MGSWIFPFTQFNCFAHLILNIREKSNFNPHSCNFTISQSALGLPNNRCVLQILKNSFQVKLAPLLLLSCAIAPLSFFQKTRAGNFIKSWLVWRRIELIAKLPWWHQQERKELINTKEFNNNSTHKFDDGDMKRQQQLRGPWTSFSWKFTEPLKSSSKKSW